LKKSAFDKLNLRPGERRLLIGVVIVVFIIVNWIFVWPRFKDWGKISARRAEAERLIHQYNREIGNTKGYQMQLNELKEQGAEVASEEQAVKLSTTVQSQAALSGVQVNRYDPVRQTALSSAGKTNQFFEEQSGIINVTTEEKNLVDFLYSLGVGGSLIRVRSMTLNPDPQRQKLQGNITLVASYAKKAPPKVVAAATTTAAKPSPSTATRPASTNTAGRAASPFRGTNAPGKTNQPVKK
jgi:hypothetical protein